jgi:hypothetical protein
VWTYNLKLAFQNSEEYPPCCGFKDPRDAPALTDYCFEQSALPGCQDYVFAYGDSYLRNIYMFVFGLCVLISLTWMSAVVFVQARNDEERFEKMAQKVFEDGNMKMRNLGGNGLHQD